MKFNKIIYLVLCAVLLVSVVIVAAVNRENPKDRVDEAPLTTEEAAPTPEIRSAAPEQSEEPAKVISTPEPTPVDEIKDQPSEYVIAANRWLDRFEAADMSGYRNLTSRDICFNRVTTRDVIDGIDCRDTFIVVFSFDKCPWCAAAIPVLNEMANEYGLRIGYVNVRENPEWKSNMDIDNYDELADRLSEFIMLDEDGLRHLIVPHVFFIIEGEVVFQYEGCGPQYDGSGNPLDEIQTRFLKDIYKNGFEKYLSDHR